MIEKTIQNILNKHLAKAKHNTIKLQWQKAELEKQIEQMQSQLDTHKD